MTRPVRIFVEGSPSAAIPSIDALVGAGRATIASDRASADIVIVDVDAVDETAEPRGSRGALSEGAGAVLLLTDAPSEAHRVAAVYGRRSRGVLPRSIDPDTLEAALAAVLAGLTVSAPHVSSDNATPIAPEPGRRARAIASAHAVDGELDDLDIETLTPRERDVLQLMADGLRNKAIASALDISEHTVKFHLASIFGKLGAHTRAQAIRTGMRRGLITL